jgi:hypothetical protein
MLEGCVTVVYTILTVGVAAAFVLAECCRTRRWLKWVDSLWGLLLGIASVVWVASMVLSGEGDNAHSACSGWLAA